MSELPQNMMALRRANTTRKRRSMLKHEILDGRQPLSCLLEEPPSFIGSMTIMELLRAQRRWGRERAVKFLWHCGGIGENKLIDELTVRQRQVLADNLREKGL